MTEEERVCRICLGGDNNDNEDRLISPCLCRGSMRYVHISCLQSWRRSSTRSESILRCDQCRYTYDIHRTALALFLLSENGPIVLTVLFLTVVVHLSGALFYVVLLKVIGGRKGVEGVMQKLYLWLRLGRQFGHIREHGMGRREPTMDVFLTETMYGQILLLGTALLGIVAFSHYAFKTFSRHYINYRRGEGRDPMFFQFDPLLQGGMSTFLFWIYREIVEVKSGRGVAVLGLVSAWYYTYGHAVVKARGLAQWIGETILEPTQPQH